MRSVTRPAAGGRASIGPPTHAELTAGWMGPMTQRPGATVAQQVELDGDGVHIAWSDGRACLYPYRYLRLQCACAGCVEEMTGRKLLNVRSVPEDVIAVEYLPVGRYALQFLWSDGHSTGIYPFEMLLRLAANDDAVVCEGA